MKPIRKAVRTFLFEKDKVLAIKYITKDKYDYYDVPGGKIENNENAGEASIREFKEESGIIINNPQYAGNLIVEYPDKIFDFEIFITTEYQGVPCKTEENIAKWIKIDDLLQKEKQFTTISLLDQYHRDNLLDKTSFSYHFIADDNHNKLLEIKKTTNFTPETLEFLVNESFLLFLKLRGYTSLSEEQKLTMKKALKQIYQVNKNQTIYCAYKNNKIVGCASITGNYINDLFVKEEYQKQGIGRVILNKIISDFENKQLTFHTYKENVEYFKNFGFDIVEENTDSIKMQR